MNVTYRDVDFDSDEDCELLSRWSNDLAIKHLYNRFDDAESFAQVLSPAYFKRLAEIPPTGGPHGSLMVMVDGAAYPWSSHRHYLGPAACSRLAMYRRDVQPVWRGHRRGARAARRLCAPART